MSKFAFSNEKVQGNFFFFFWFSVIFLWLLQWTFRIFPDIYNPLSFLFFMQEHVMIEITTLTAVQALQSHYLLNYGDCIAGFLIGLRNLFSRNWINLSTKYGNIRACVEFMVFSRRKDKGFTKTVWNNFTDWEKRWAVIFLVKLCCKTVLFTKVFSDRRFVTVSAVSAGINKPLGIKR